MQRYLSLIYADKVCTDSLSESNLVAASDNLGDLRSFSLQMRKGVKWDACAKGVITNGH